jgi:uncharacterized membrane protein YedE/YeeE
MNQTIQERATPEKSEGWVGYLLLGIAFGIILTKSEAISWFRIQEMFRFQAFHMCGIIGAAVGVAAVAVALIKTFKVKTVRGLDIHIPPKTMDNRYWIGGTIFGLGWALAGACPGPLFALIGNGVPVMAVSVISALAGTWTYGALRSRLPH